MGDLFKILNSFLTVSAAKVSRLRELSLYKAVGIDNIKSIYYIYVQKVPTSQNVLIIYEYLYLINTTRLEQITILLSDTIFFCNG